MNFIIAKVLYIVHKYIMRKAYTPSLIEGIWFSYS